MGFEVYLSVDEFSWSKNAQPSLIRRQIVNMSVAGDFHVNLFPVDIPVNIANPRTLRRLLELFPNQKVYFVVGSDVPSNASSYKAPSRPWSIHPDEPHHLPPSGRARAAQEPAHHRRRDPAATALLPEGHQLHPHPGGRGLQPGHLQPHRPGDSGLHLSERPVPAGQPEQAHAGGWASWSSRWLGAPDLSLLGQMSALLPGAGPPCAPPSPGTGTGC